MFIFYVMKIWWLGVKYCWQYVKHICVSRKIGMLVRTLYGVGDWDGVILPYLLDKINATWGSRVRNLHRHKYFSSARKSRIKNHRYKWKIYYFSLSKQHHVFGTSFTWLVRPTFTPQNHSVHTGTVFGFISPSGYFFKTQNLVAMD